MKAIEQYVPLVLISMLHVQDSSYKSVLRSEIVYETLTCITIQFQRYTEQYFTVLLCQITAGYVIITFEAESYGAEFFCGCSFPALRKLRKFVNVKTDKCGRR